MELHVFKGWDEGKDHGTETSWSGCRGALPR